MVDHSNPASVKCVLVTAALLALLLPILVHAQPAPSTSDQLRTRTSTTISPEMAATIRERSLVSRDVIVADDGSAANRERLLAARRAELARLERERLSATAATSPDAAPAPVREPPAEITAIDLAPLGQVQGIRSATAFRDGTAAEQVDTSGVVALGKGDFLSVLSNDATPITLQANGNVQTASPTLLYTVDDAGTARELALVHRTQGLRWNPARSSFMGTLLVGIIDRADPLAEATLPRPIPVQLLSVTDALRPTELAIDRIGGRFAPVEVALQAPDDPFVIGLVSPIDPDLPAASLALQRLPVTISGPTVLDGFGLGEGLVTVRAASGRLQEGESLTLHLDNGVLDQTTLTIGANGIAATRVRSVAGGTGTVELVGGPYRAEPWRIRYGMPWLWLAATVAGAMLGATIFIYALARSTDNKRRLLIDWLVGCIVGIGATAMVYAGMDLPDKVPMPKELVGAIVPFAVAFVCAAMGAALIHFLTGFQVSRPAGE